jgi:hypothetical protein
MDSHGILYPETIRASERWRPRMGRDRTTAQIVRTEPHHLDANNQRRHISERFTS